MIVRSLSSSHAFTCYYFIMKNDSISPKVSIVIPVYNGENYIQQAINSALAQDYDNFEVLIIDDGSTDKTAEICKSFTDNRVRYIYKKNGGVSSALNLGIKEMEGEYFSWLSHDDLYERNKVSEEINYLRKSNLLGTKTIVFSDYELIDEAGFHITSTRVDRSNIKEKQEYVILEGKIDGLSLLIPKTAFKECGDFSTALTAIQDYDLWWRFLKKYTFIHLDKVLVSTRCHSKQVTNTSPKVLSEGNSFYIKAIDSLSEKRMCELEGSVYSFYSEMNRYFSNTIHTEVAEHCAKKMQKIAACCNDTPEISVAIIDDTDNISDCLETVFAQDYKGKIHIFVPSTIDKLPLAPKNRKKQFDIIKLDNVSTQKDFILSVSKQNSNSAILLLNSGDQLSASAIGDLSTAFCVSKAAIVSGKDQKSPEIIYAGNCQREILTNNPSSSLFLLSKDFLSREIESRSSVVFNKNGKLVTKVMLLDALKGNYISSTNSVVVSTNDDSLSVSDKIASAENVLIATLSLPDHLYLSNEITSLIHDYDYLLHKEQPSSKIVMSKPQKALYFLRKEGVGGIGKRFCKKLLSIARHK